MIVSRSDNGILVRIPNGEVAEIQGYVSTADTAFSHGAVSAELSELQAIKRWVEHLLRLADGASLTGSSVRSDPTGAVGTERVTREREADPGSVEDLS